MSSVELGECVRYADRAPGETALDNWQPNGRFGALFLSEGFEERSLGVLQRFADSGIRVPQIVIGRYVKDLDLNREFRQRLEYLADLVAPGSWAVVENNDDGRWVSDVLANMRGYSVAVDITGFSNRGLFGALDSLYDSRNDATIMYCEPADYWPKEESWRELSPEYIDAEDLANRTDESEWLYSGRNFHVELIQGHEGFDVAGSSALVAFLPFKAGRLAAVMSHAEYSQCVFIAGRPRRPENIWRLHALKQINKAATRDWPVVEMSTFGYREGLREMAELLFSVNGLSNRCDIHVAPMGSKLQTISCWAMSRITRALTVVAGTPSRYFPRKYSEGIGMSWSFPFCRPD